jgi:hypothetical protein
LKKRQLRQKFFLVLKTFGFKLKKGLSGMIPIDLKRKFNMNKNNRGTEYPLPKKAHPVRGEPSKERSAVMAICARNANLFYGCLG